MSDNLLEPRTKKGFPSYARKRIHQKVEALGKEMAVRVRVDKKRGKGSHQTLYFGEHKTIIRNPKDELKTGTYHAMLKQLGIRRRT
jgi:mRNA interferase HicA